MLNDTCCCFALRRTLARAKRRVGSHDASEA